MIPRRRCPMNIGKFGFCGILTQESQARIESEPRLLREQPASSEQLTISLIVHDDFSHIETALQSLYASTRTSFQVYVTINQGLSAQVEQLRAAYPLAQIVVNQQSTGFATNHNAIMRLAQTPYVALINDDVSFRPQSLDILVDYLDAHQDVALVGPLVENPDGSMQLSTFSDPTLPRMFFHLSGLGNLTRHGGLARRLAHELGITRLLRIESLNPDRSTRDVPVIVGVCMVVRRDAYLQAGMMDTHTLVYGEEVGWHLRLRQHGWRVVFVPSARVTHYNRQQDITGWKLAEHRKSILAYFLTYRPRWQAVIIRLIIIVFHMLGLLYSLLFDQSRADAHWRTVKMAATWRPARGAAAGHG